MNGPIRFSRAFDLQEAIQLQDWANENLINRDLEITNVVVEYLSPTSVRVKWNLSDYATGVVYYGLTDSYGSQTTEETSFDYNKHNQLISGLTPDTVYHFSISSESASGAVATTADATFTTSSEAQTKPIITLVGDNPLYLNEGDNYTELGATALDDTDGDITSSIVVDNSSINMSVPGSYSVTYNVQNSQLIAADEVTRSVQVAAVGGGTPITGLQSGSSVSVAQNNTAVLNAAFETPGANLTIPVNTGAVPIDFNGDPMTGYWAIYDRVKILVDGVTVTFEGGLMQLEAAKDSDFTAFRIEASNITLNNPLLSQGEYYRTDKPGTHSVLSISGSTSNTDVTINDGLIAGGGSNNFQSGRNNTIFNRTVFSRSREHGIYASGPSPDVHADGLQFNDCIIEYPGIIAEAVAHEANHIQIRNFDNVTMTNCQVYGRSNTELTQAALNLTDLTGLTVTNCNFSDYRQQLYRTDARDVSYGNVFDVNFDGGSAQGDSWYKKDNSTNKTIRKAYTITELSTIKNMTFYTPKSCRGWTRFENCIFDFEVSGVPFNCYSLSKLEFHDCTFDLSSSSTTLAMEVESGATAPVFSGTTTRIGSCDDWGPIPS